jgi:hypothetical protein
VTKIGFEASLPALTESEALFTLGAGWSSRPHLGWSVQSSQKESGRTPGLMAGVHLREGAPDAQTERCSPVRCLGCPARIGAPFGMRMTPISSVTGPKSARPRPSKTELPARRVTPPDSARACSAWSRDPSLRLSLAEAILVPALQGSWLGRRRHGGFFPVSRRQRRPIHMHLFGSAAGCLPHSGCPRTITSRLQTPSFRRPGASRDPRLPWIPALPV